MDVERTVIERMRTMVEGSAMSESRNAQMAYQSRARM